jgi:predicted Zn-dependent protease
VLLVGCLTALLIVAGVRQFIRRPPPGPDVEFKTLLAEVAARPTAVQPRVALARHLTERRLTSGVAMELSLLPASAPRAAREMAGIAFIELDLREKAASVYQALLQESPDPRLAGRVVALLREQGDFPAALAACENALAVSPGHAELERERLRCLLDLGDYRRVGSLVEPMLLRQPGDIELRIMLAWAHLLNKQPKETITLLLGLPDDQTHSWAEVLRGRALLEAGRPKDVSEAEFAFERAIAAAPDLFEAHLGLAETAVRQRKWARAVNAGHRAADLRPDAPQPWRLLTRAYAALARAPEAEWSRGCAALAEEDPAAAVPPLRRAVAARTDVLFVKDLARALVTGGQFQPAFALLAQATARDPDPALLRYWYDTAFERRDFPEALRPARRLAARPQPRVAAEGLGLVGQVLREQGDRAGAERQITAALARVPGEPIFYAERGRTLLEGGTPEMVARAEADLQRAAATNPPVPPLYYDLAVASLARKRPQDAFLYLHRNMTLLQDRDLDMPLALLAKTCTQLRLHTEARWCGDWARELQRAEDRFRVAVARRPSAARDRDLATAALARRELAIARAACLRLTRREPLLAEHWLRLAAVGQQMGLYDERVAAIERWRSLRGGSAGAQGQPG